MTTQSGSEVARETRHWESALREAREKKEAKLLPLFRELGMINRRLATLIDTYEDRTLDEYARVQLEIHRVMADHDKETQATRAQLNERLMATVDAIGIIERLGTQAELPMEELFAIRTEAMEWWRLFEERRQLWNQEAKAASATIPAPAGNGEEAKC